MDHIYAQRRREEKQLRKRPKRCQIRELDKLFHLSLKINQEREFKHEICSRVAV